jgi:hypothetical protein
VAAKFEFEKAKKKISRNIAISHYIVPARVGNSRSQTFSGRYYKTGGIGGFTTPVVTTTYNHKRKQASYFSHFNQPDFLHRL